MGDLSKMFGQGATLLYQDKAYKLSPWLYRVQADFEIYLEEQAWGTYKRAARNLSESEVEKLRMETARDITSGKYSAGGPIFIESIWIPKHAKMFLYLLVEVNHPEISKATVDGMFDSNPQMCFEKVMEAGSDPSRKPPATAPPAVDVP